MLLNSVTKKLYKVYNKVFGVCHGMQARISRGFLNDSAAYAAYTWTLLAYGKGKVRGFVQRLVVNTPLRLSGMARVLKGSHSFTCTPRVHRLTE